MITLTRRSALFAAGVCLAAVLSAESLVLAVPGADENERARFREGASVIADAGTPAKLRLAPRGAEGDAIRAAAAAKPSAILIESAFLVRGADLSGPRRAAILTALCDVEGLSGVTYFSHRRDRETVLLDEVFRTDAPGSKTRLAPASGAEAAAFHLHARDANFGSTWYRFEGQAAGSGIVLSLVNTKPQGIFVLRAFETGALRLHFSLVQVDEGVYVYGICAADPARSASAAVDMFSAVEKRLNAVRGWVVSRVAGGK